jgi:DsbC/DsbD-like thiol-disulfide interchange protein
VFVAVTSPVVRDLRSLLCRTCGVVNLALAIGDTAREFAWPAPSVMADGVRTQPILLVAGVSLEVILQISLRDREATLSGGVRSTSCGHLAV